MKVKEFQIDNKEVSESFKKLKDAIKENQEKLSSLSSVVKSVANKKQIPVNEVSLSEMLNELKIMYVKEKPINKIKNWEKKRLYQK